MKLEHIAIWTEHLEELRAFYETYFDASSGKKYTSASHPFESYFLSFQEGTRLELMRQPGLLPGNRDPKPPTRGLVHLSFSSASREGVDQLTSRLRLDGFTILDGPRLTGDGYYESVVLDPDGNRLEITI